MNTSRRRISLLGAALVAFPIGDAQDASAEQCSATSGNVVYVIGHCWNDSAGNFYSVIDEEFIGPAGLQFFRELGTQ
jgi:hypothetical protein